MKRLRKDGWEIGFFELTVDDAKKAMELMTEDQRTSSERSIRNLVSEMNGGNFGLSNDAFVRTQSGVFLNGKHRAQAVIRTGRAVEILLLTVPDKDANTVLKIMDCGVTRTVAHVAQMMTRVSNASIVASIAKMTMALERGLLTCKGCYASSNRTDQGKFISRDEHLDYIKAHAAQLEASGSLSKRLNAEYGLLGTTGPGFVHYLVSRKYSTKMADQFLAVLFSGKGEKSDSVEPLRKALIKDMRSVRRVSSMVKIASMMKAFAAWNNGTIPTRPFVGISESLPKI